MIDAAEPVAMGRMPDPAPGSEKYGYRAGEWRGEGFVDETGFLPVECPVTPLGVDGDIYWFLDTIDQVRAIPAGKFNRNTISSLFMMRSNWLRHHWPKTRDGKMVSGMAADEVTDALINACGAKGNWNDIEAVRGRGCWRAVDGALVVHCGDRLVVRGGEMDLGEQDGFVYPSRPALPAPAAGRGRAEGPGAVLFRLLMHWRFKRGRVDAVLALGFIGAAFLSGALEWRPSIFITGDKATGKSTLQKLFKWVLGGWLVQSADTTPAGIYQRVKHDALPVSVDELESEKDPYKQKAILKLARLSSQGALMLRGGADHKGTEFQARSCFAFSSINHPPMEPQDLSRMAMLLLDELEAGAVPPGLDHGELALLGRQILGRLIANWDRFDATLRDYQIILGEAGHDGRGQDTFGTLLACADLIVDGDAAALGLPMGEEDLTPWGELLRADTLAEYEGAEKNWRLCLGHILTTPIEAWRGGTRQTVGDLLDAFMRDAVNDLPFERVKSELSAAGLSIKRTNSRSTDFRLFIPNQNPALQRLFWGTKWYGEINAGVWAGALKQGPEDWIHPAERERVSGWQTRGICVPLDRICEELISEVRRGGDLAGG